MASKHPVFEKASLNADKQKQFGELGISLAKLKVRRLLLCARSQRMHLPRPRSPDTLLTLY